MNLCIDQGNSRTKIAIFEGERLKKHIIYKHFSSLDVERLFSLYPIDNSIISSVSNIEPSVVNALHRLSKRCVLFDHTTSIPIKNCYDTPATLGQDRLAAAVAAAHLYPSENVLIVDVGSAITYDVVTEQNEYIGGNIAPGLKMRFSVLKQMTKKLPYVEVEAEELIPLFGKNTHDAIAAGVIRGTIFEVKGYMRALAERVAHFETIITGGNNPYIIKSIECAHVEKHLVLIGLNVILNYNENA
ncbi:MAG: type III pantothenate kinase [Paludibacteraceae bacterium]|nr:type III pantothenate kinase [Paludibacteraceae bacterium]